MQDTVSHFKEFMNVKGQKDNSGEKKQRMTSVTVELCRHREGSLEKVRQGGREDGESFLEATQRHVQKHWV